MSSKVAYIIHLILSVQMFVQDVLLLLLLFFIYFFQRKIVIPGHFVRWPGASPSAFREEIL